MGRHPGKTFADKTSFLEESKNSQPDQPHHGKDSQEHKCGSSDRKRHGPVNLADSHARVQRVRLRDSASEMRTSASVVVDNLLSRREP